MAYNAISIARQLNKLLTGLTLMDTLISPNDKRKQSVTIQQGQKIKEKKKGHKRSEPGFYKLKDIEKNHDYFEEKMRKDEDPYYFSFDHDTSFTSYFSAEDCLQSINESYEYSSKFLKSCNYLFITLGTSYGYELREQQAFNSTNASYIQINHQDTQKEEKKNTLDTDHRHLVECKPDKIEIKNQSNSTILFDEESQREIKVDYNPDKIVTNCHRLPHITNFKKVLIDNEVATLVLSQALIRLIDINPSITIFLTVSPIRHTREGMVENSRSKAELLITAHNICEKLNKYTNRKRIKEEGRNNNRQLRSNQRNMNYCFYFPSYEIVMDDLRDYRFYEDDLIHPSSLAIEYIYQQLQKCLFDQKPSSVSIRERIQRIQKAVEHRPRSYKTSSGGKTILTKEHERFVQNFLREIEEIEQIVPLLKGRFENEKIALKLQLVA